MRGLQKSLLIGLLGALISTGLAGVLGAFAGYFGGWADRLVIVLIDLLLILPALPDHRDPVPAVPGQDLADLRAAASRVPVDAHRLGWSAA